MTESNEISGTEIAELVEAVVEEVAAAEAAPTLAEIVEAAVVGIEVLPAEEAAPVAPVSHKHGDLLSDWVIRPDVERVVSFGNAASIWHQPARCLKEWDENSKDSEWLAAAFAAEVASEAAGNPRAVWFCPRCVVVKVKLAAPAASNAAAKPPVRGRLTEDERNARDEGIYRLADDEFTCIECGLVKHAHDAVEGGNGLLCADCVDKQIQRDGLAALKPKPARKPRNRQASNA
jgi:hypothetical protein